MLVRLSVPPLLTVRWCKKNTLAGWKQSLSCKLHPTHILHILYTCPASHAAGRVLSGMADVIWNVMFLGLNSKGPAFCSRASSAHTALLPWLLCSSHTPPQRSSHTPSTVSGSLLCCSYLCLSLRAKPCLSPCFLPS